MSPTKQPKKAAAKAKKPAPRANNLTLGLPGGKQTPPARVERKRVNHTGRDQRIRRSYDSPGGPI